MLDVLRIIIKVIKMNMFINSCSIFVKILEFIVKRDMCNRFSEGLMEWEFEIVIIFVKIIFLCFLGFIIFFVFIFS